MIAGVYALQVRRLLGRDAENPSDIFLGYYLLVETGVYVGWMDDHLHFGVRKARICYWIGIDASL